MQTVHAIFENGVFRPTAPVSLPEKCEVTFEPRLVQDMNADASFEDIHLILSKRCNSGEHDVAARHNEHQP